VYPEKPVIGLEFLGCIEVAVDAAKPMDFPPQVDMLPKKWMQNLKKIMQFGSFTSYMLANFSLSSTRMHGDNACRHRDSI
jgi:hypothetical protein